MDINLSEGVLLISSSWVRKQLDCIYLPPEDNKTCRYCGKW